VNALRDAMPCAASAAAAAAASVTNRSPLALPLKLLLERESARAHRVTRHRSYGRRQPSDSSAAAAHIGCVPAKPRRALVATAAATAFYDVTD